MIEAVALFCLALVVLWYALRRPSRSPRVEQRVSREALNTAAKFARQALYPNDR